MRVEWVRCSCDGGYAGADGHTCSRCEGSGMREEIVADPGDCPRCQGFGKIAWMQQLIPCPLNCGSEGYKEL